uniref:Meiosis regulator and mRNA stability factor 1 n=1 Tax=Timema genevievae TaxID=629358 RepID=A0A7R9PPB5_TIMGE|nr:unnamed protein product [Timema genevievae]
METYHAKPCWNGYATLDMNTLIDKALNNIGHLQKLVDISSPSDDFKTEETNSLEMDQSSNSSFVFPPPPQMRSCRPLSASPYFCVSDSDSHSDSGWGGGGSSSPLAIRHSVLALRGYQSDGSPVNLRSLPSFLPPIGVFWDIENCHVPKGRSALAVVEVIRTKFFKGYREVEFLVVCDVTKENAQVVQELNDAQINLIHVAATCKNAADEKLRQSIRRFADIHGSPAAIILISGDINFASDLSDLKHRKKFHVILLHNNHTSEALILCANEHYNFTSLMENVPARSAKTIKPTVNQAVEVTISNLPEDKDVLRVRSRLKQLSENCGGRIVTIARSFATIRFSTSEFAARAQRRMDGQDVFGHKICVSLPHRMPDKSSREMSPMKTRKLRHNSRSDDENVLSQSPRAPRPIMSGLNVLNSIPTPNMFSNLAWNPGFAGAHHSGFGSLMNFQDVSVPPPAMEAAVKGWENGTHQSQLTGYPWNPSVPMASQRVLTNSGRGLGESFHDAAPGRFHTIKGTHGGLQSSRHGNTNQELNSAGAMPLLSCHLVNGTNPSILKRCRTSSPTADLQQIQTPAVFGFPFPLKRRSPSPYTVLDAETDVLGENSQHFFHPIAPSKTELLTASVNSSIQLIVTNLDQTIEPKEMKRVLLALFREHVMVIHISVFTQTDGNVAAHVKVPSLQDAQYAISQLHRRKVGFKRMLIAYAHGGGPSPQLIRSQIVSLLLEVPGHSLPLFKFRELFESRYLSSISVSDMYKMKDVCIIREDPSGRMVSLNPDHRNTPSPSFGVGTQDGQMDLPYCTLHPQRPGAGKGWAEQDLEALPNFRIGLNILAERIHTLLHSHNGSLPLPRSVPENYSLIINILVFSH